MILFIKNEKNYLVKGNSSFVTFLNVSFVMSGQQKKRERGEKMVFLKIVGVFFKISTLQTPPLKPFYCYLLNQFLLRSMVPPVFHSQHLMLKVYIQRDGCFANVIYSRRPDLVAILLIVNPNDKTELQITDVFVYLSFLHVHIEHQIYWVEFWWNQN